jgi:tetratricopeptide (TPR) repeat protein
MTLATLFVFPAFHGCLPSGPDAAEVLGEAEALLAQGRTSQAIDILEEFEERKPGNADVIEQLAFAYAANGDPKMAAHYFSHLAELGPGREQSLVFAAQSMEKAGDQQGAMVTYEKYLTLQPDDAGTQLAYAVLAESMGRPDRALKAAEVSYESSPSGAAALMSARILAASGDHQGAGQWYGRALNHPESVREASLGSLRESVTLKDFEAAESMLATIRRDFPGAIEASDQKNIPAQIERWRAQVEADKRRLVEETARRAPRLRWRLLRTPLLQRPLQRSLSVMSCLHHSLLSQRRFSRPSSRPGA